MIRSKRRSRFLHVCHVGLSTLALGQLSLAPVLAAGGPNNASERTQTPIKHVIVIIGENRSFDHVFATLDPKNGQKVSNLLSKGIITLDAQKNARPGPTSKLHISWRHRIAVLRIRFCSARRSNSFQATSCPRRWSVARKFHTFPTSAAAHRL